MKKSADAINQALEMKTDEQNRRMEQMRHTLVGNNIYSWAASLLRTMANI
ncbi:MAG: trehalose-6-phosphate synthase [Saprospiraceae bacterium]|uniref:Trehalose-6-phosphate synthase n=1 Tax=Candidatus Defluviibacterium haderslevense TaxID=2981993 RepID=A0A9D7XDH5_9BACT|nr:trehalose-6-phosphate synthase [Candidatus Defluviibacterium haderslevense]